MRWAQSILIPFVLILGACISSSPLGEYGIRKEFEAYIPARIAVLSCMTLPPSARYQGLAPVNISSETLNSLCQDFDRKVLDGFTDQPFMKGYTPTLVAQLLEKNNATRLLRDIPVLWVMDKATCSECKSGPAAYISQIEASPGWRSWLNQLSKATLFSDAVLIPFLVEAWENQTDDRGVLLSTRHVKVDLFLIDSNHGKLLWSGTRSAAINNQSLRESPDSGYPPYPHWDRLRERLYSEALWLGFPGRQTND